MPPFIGQGLGAGLRDAHNLSWKVAAVLAERADEELLDSYPRERVPHVRATIRTAVLVGRAMTGGGGPAALVRRPLAAALLRLPGAEQRALAAIPTRFPPGLAVQRSRRRHDLAGTLCPQPRLTQPRMPGSVLLDEAVGPGWGLLHAGPVDARTAADARATSARTIDVSSTPLHTWLRSGRTTAALLRPDRVVARTAPG
jgi:3-(3-hydroxy-phenyl)propionate hydroxylase